jgi:hypothetical protein
VVAIRGVAEVNRALTNAGNAPGKLIDVACQQGLEPMRLQTELNAMARRQPHTPKGGHLDEGVVVAKIQSKGQFFREYWISFTKRARKLAHLVEFGTAPHWQPNWRGGSLHPGARPYPFARPAFEAKKGGVADVMGRVFWAGIAATIRGVSK